MEGPGLALAAFKRGDGYLDGHSMGGSGDDGAGDGVSVPGLEPAQHQGLGGWAGTVRVTQWTKPESVTSESQLIQWMAASGHASR